MDILYTEEMFSFHYLEVHRTICRGGKKVFKYITIYSFNMHLLNVSWKMPGTIYCKEFLLETKCWGYNEEQNKIPDAKNEWLIFLFNGLMNMVIRI